MKGAHPDQKYVDALVNNNATLLEEIYQKFSGKVRGIIMANNGTETDAADIFQEALISVYKKAKTGNFILTCPFEAFLYLISKNKWLNELKKRKVGKVTFIEPEGLYSLTIGVDSFGYTEEHQILQSRKDLLREKINELGGTCKELLRLSWSVKSMEEVAKILKVTYGYVRKKKCACMARLIALVKNSPEFNSFKW